MAPDVFGATDIDTDPLPVPDAPLVIVIHPAADVAVHVQLASVVTLVPAAPPRTAIAALAGAIVYVHAGGGGGGGGGGAAA